MEWESSRRLHLNEIRADFIMGHYIRDATEANNLELGLPKYLFIIYLTSMKKCLTPIWITNTWQFTDKYDILVEEMTPNLCLQILNNSFLMKDLIEVGYEGEKLAELNKCRMNLHVTCLYDIIIGDGRLLASNSLSGYRGESRDLYSLPPQPSPNKKYGRNGKRHYGVSTGLH